MYRLSQLLLPEITRNLAMEVVVVAAKQLKTKRPETHQTSPPSHLTPPELNRGFKPK